MPDPSVYRFRPNAFAGTRTVSLTDDALVVEEDGKPRDGAFFDEIAEVQLAYAPTRFATNRYRARIVYRKGGMAELTNESYRSLGDFKEQNAEYAAFLTELHRRLAARGRAVRFVRGSSTGAYIGNAVLTAFIFVCLAAIFVMLRGVGALLDRRGQGRDHPLLRSDADPLHAARQARRLRPHRHSGRHASRALRRPRLTALPGSA